MTLTSGTKIDRRQFLNAGLTRAAVTFGCLRFGLEEALAQSERTGKPILTDKNLNEFVLEQARNNKLREFEAAENEPIGFLEKRLTVTDEQRRQYDSLSKEDKETIRKAIQIMAKEEGIVKWRFVTRKKTSGPRVELKLSRSGAEMKPTSFVSPDPTAAWFFMPPVKGE